MIRTYLEMASSYRSVAGWLVRDIRRTLGVRMIGLAALSLAVIVAKVVTFGGFLLYLRSAVSGEPAVVPRIGVALPELAPAVWAWVILGSGFVLGGLVYVEARIRVVLSARYALSAMERALDIFSASDFETRGKGGLTHQNKVRLLSSDAWAMMRAAFPILSMMLPLIQLLCTALILVAMSWRMAVVVAVLGLCYAVPFVVLNRRVAQASRQRQDSGPGFKAGVVGALDRIAYPQYRAARAEDARRLMFENAHLHDQVEAFRIIRTTKGAVTFLNSVALAVVMFILMLHVGRSGSDFVLIGLAAYGVLLLHAYAATNAITSQIAAFNRFLPQFRRYVDVLTRAETHRPPKAEARPLRFRLGPGPALPGSRSSLSLAPSQVILVFQPRRLLARTRDRWLEGIGLRGARQGRVFAASPAADFPDLTLRQIAQGHRASPDSQEEDGHLLALPFLRRAIEELPDGLDTKWSSAAAEPALALTLAVAPAIGENPAAILVDGRSWNAVAEEDRARVRELLPRTGWLVDAGGSAAALAPDVTHVLFADEAGLIGIGDRDWAAAALAELPGLAAGSPQRTADLVDDDEFDEDMV